SRGSASVEPSPNGSEEEPQEAEDDEGKCCIFDEPQRPVEPRYRNGAAQASRSASLFLDPVIPKARLIPDGDWYCQPPNSPNDGWYAGTDSITEMPELRLDAVAYETVVVAEILADCDELFETLDRKRTADTSANRKDERGYGRTGANGSNSVGRLHGG